MTIFFHIVSARWPQSDCRTASLSEHGESSNTQSLSLNSLCPTELKFTTEELKALSQQYEQDNDASKWTDYTMVESIRYSRIQNVSFIPKKPHLTHVAYMKRSTENEDLTQSKCFTFGLPGYILGAKKVNGWFFLAKKSIKETLQGIDVEDCGPLERILTCFQHEEETLGIALTILERSSLVSTYLWLK